MKHEYKAWGFNSPDAVDLMRAFRAIGNVESNESVGAIWIGTDSDNANEQIFEVAHDRGVVLRPASAESPLQRATLRHEH